MRAILTSKGQITIPITIRRKLGLKIGQTLEFDETVPFLKAVPVFDEEAMRSVLGCTRRKLGRRSEAWLNETRGMVKIPRKQS